MVRNTGHDIIQDARKAGLDTEGDYLEKVVDLMVYALYFRPEAVRDGLFITDEVTRILGDKAVAARAIPSVTGKRTANPIIAAAVGKGIPLYGFIRRRRGRPYPDR